MRVYRRRGFRFEIKASPDKQELLALTGATLTEHPRHRHDWPYPDVDTDWNPQRQLDRGWAGSKVGCNLNRFPLPTIAGRDELWRELCEPFDLTDQIPERAKTKVRRFLDGLPRPIVLFHGTGNSGGERKSLSFSVQQQFYRELLDRVPGTLIILDWDNRTPRLANYRVRPLESMGECSAVELLALIDAAELMIGVDSGPLHLASLTLTPTVGIWQPGHYPSTYSVPRTEQLNLVLADHTREWNRVKRIPWNIVEHPGGRFDPAWTAERCIRMLHLPRYLRNHGTIAQDLQLQQFVREFCRGGANPGGLSDYCDRNNTFDRLLQEAARRFDRPPVFVETGCIRSEEDWGGAGFSTYLFGAYLSAVGGRLHAFDCDPNSVRFARDWTAVFGDTVHVESATGEDGLRDFDGKIDVLSLDSADTEHPGHADICLAELQAAEAKLHSRSLVLIDDTPFSGGWRGKGRKAVPWAVEHGWKILTAGYQVLLSR